MVCLGRTYHFKFFKGCLPQILFGPFLNTLIQLRGVANWKISQNQPRQYICLFERNKVNVIQFNLIFCVEYLIQMFSLTYELCLIFRVTLAQLSEWKTKITNFNPE